MYTFIVDELMFATAQEVREQARRARPHVAERPARRARGRSRFARNAAPAARTSDAAEAKRNRGCC